jgi:hypothetical protein
MIPITRRHFLAYKAGCAGAPPPLHVESANPMANYWQLPRPIEGGAHVGPVVVMGGTGSVCMGIDPTDPLTWEGRGYSQSPGMIGYLNGPVTTLTRHQDFGLNAYGGPTSWTGGGA